jgi:uracil-DNA glycosylase
MATVRAGGHGHAVPQRRLLGWCERCTTASDAASSPCEGRTQVVFGAGRPNADLMFIGEAPGKDEKGSRSLGRKPGQAGAILDERLHQERATRKSATGSPKLSTR